MASAELHKLVAILRSSKIASDPTIEEIRAGWEKFTASFVPAADLSFKPVVARGVAAALVTAPHSDWSRVAFYFQRGGYTIGSIASYRSFTGRLPRATRGR